MKKIKHIKRIVSLFLISAVAMTLMPSVAYAAEYSDISGHWAETAIKRWSDYGILQGNDGKFRPDDTITRAELTAILNRMLKYP